MKLTTTTRTLYGGTILTETRNDLGQLHDPADGTAARIFIYANGHRMEQHWRNGVFIESRYIPTAERAHADANDALAAAARAGMEEAARMLLDEIDGDDPDDARLSRVVDKIRAAAQKEGA